MTTIIRKSAGRPGIIAQGRTIIGSALVALVAPALLAPGTLDSIAKGAGVVAAADVPTPRTNPRRAHSDLSDPIAGVISAVTGEHHAGFEDSDTPMASFAPVTPAAPAVSKAPADINTIGLRYAIKFLDEGDPAAATAAAYAMPHPVDTKVIDWLVAISGREDVPAAHIAGVWNKLSNWPGQTLLQTRFEQALVRENPPAETVINAMNGRKPVTDSGTYLLANAYLEAGRKKDAAKVVSTYWREERFGSAEEAKFRKSFGNLLTAADYKTRSDRLLYEEQTSAALRNAGYLGKNEQSLAAAVVAVSNGKNAANALAAVPAAMRKDPLYTYARIQYLRRADKFEEATKLMLAAPTDPARIDGDAWWVERRILSRELLDLGDAKTAYRIAAAHSAESSAPIAEAEFHAGWYALEYLGDPITAKRHFAKIHPVSSRPLSQSRADYWLGRAAEKAGNKAEAIRYYRQAGKHPSAFYGQLALAQLGERNLPITPSIKIDKSTRDRFESRELVQVIKRLDSLNRSDRNVIFYRALANELTDPGEIELVAEMAREHGGNQLALQIGKLAAYRGLPVETTAFPTSAIPKSAKTGQVDKSMVYAIARQESAFNPGAISGAGARGLLQLMPATAKSMAKSVGLPYSKARLTTDPAYNASLGAAFLGQLQSSFGGSFVMTFAGYNAGPSRVKTWVERYGDPRDPNVDVVNWIERIPFTETRNYVQRIMENMQVYRARLGSPALTIHTDLKQGRV